MTGYVDKALADYGQAIRLLKPTMPGRISTGALPTKRRATTAEPNWTLNKPNGSDSSRPTQYPAAFRNRRTQGIGLLRNSLVHRGLQDIAQLGKIAAPKSFSTVPTPSGGMAIGKMPSPSTRRPLVSTRTLPRRITAGAASTTTGENTTRPLPTITRPSGSNPKYAKAYYNRGCRL